MNQRQRTPQHRSRNPVYRQAFERLDEALAENTRPDPDEIGRILRRDEERLKPAAEPSSRNEEVYPGKSDQIRPLNL